MEKRLSDPMQRVTSIYDRYRRTLRAPFPFSGPRLTRLVDPLTILERLGSDYFASASISERTSSMNLSGS
jgi:hypothetical protein